MDRSKYNIIVIINFAKSYCTLPLNRQQHIKFPEREKHEESGHFCKTDSHES